MQTMAETATESTTIAATPEAVWNIVLDIERYPEWAHDVKDAKITRRDDEGRPAEVEFRSSALGRSTHYTLVYDYSAAPSVLSWTMLKGDIQRSIDGAYHFSESADGGTDVRYDLAIELVVPLPGFVKRRAEVRILNTLKELKARAEGS
jgi:ribosome-associated toxin RatA of RatAB toxin-antitoxin module